MKANSNPLRILSLLPGATEVVCKLGAIDQLVGRSHECDYPPTVQALPSCTEPKYEVQFDSGATNRRIHTMIREGLSIYRVDEQKLSSLQPDVIITQDHCEACAVPYDEIQKAVDKLLDKPVQLLDFGPSNLSDLYQDIATIASAFNTSAAGQTLINQMKEDFRGIQMQTSAAEHPSVVLLEWLDPLMSSGNWLPELITMAGGDVKLAETGAHAEPISMENLRSVDPDILILAPCGYDLKETRHHLPEITERSGWHQLQAVKNKRVYLVDANQYFNRPGPRLTNSARIAAEILHPDKFEPSYQNTGWRNIAELEIEGNNI